MTYRNNFDSSFAQQSFAHRGVIITHLSEYNMAMSMFLDKARMKRPRWTPDASLSYLIASPLCDPISW